MSESKYHIGDTCNTCHLEDSDIHLNRKFECYSAHVKPGELLEAA